MYLYSFSPGDRLLVKKAAVIDDAITHSGTYIGDGLVAHLSPRKGLIVEPVEAFANGQVIQVVENQGICEHLLRERLKMCQADPKYRLFGNNCEHLCSFLETGNASSPQLQGGVAGFVTGCIAARSNGINDPWGILGLISLTTLIGVKLGAPKAKTAWPSSVR